MFETMTAVMGLVGAAIFLAHAFEGIRSGVDLSGSVDRFFEKIRSESFLQSAGFRLNRQTAAPRTSSVRAKLLWDPSPGVSGSSRPPVA
jgi:hypothetical protein